MANNAESGLIKLLGLEQQIRKAESISAIRFIAVNALSELIPHSQAVWLDAENWHVTAISSLSIVDRTAPAVAWIERLAKYYNRSNIEVKPTEITADLFPEETVRDWSDFSPQYILWIPAVSIKLGKIGILTLARQDAPFTEAEKALAALVGEVLGHAVGAFNPRPPFFRTLIQKTTSRTKKRLLGALFVLLLLPIRLSVVSQAEIAPESPMVITAPIRGVVKRIEVQPNEMVKKGQVLVRMEDTVLSSKPIIAERATQVAEAELRRAEQGAFDDPAARAKLSALEAQRDYQVSETDLANQELDRTVIKADSSGVAIFSDPAEWLGKAVDVGERILIVADPKSVELKLYIPVKDVTLLHVGAEVSIFMDSSPLFSHEATITRARFEPETAPDGTLSYVAFAKIIDKDFVPRVGTRGAARVYGYRVPLFWLLFRRPLVWVRQWLA